MRKITVGMVLVVGSLFFGSTKVGAAFLETTCGWCGDRCTNIAIKSACADIAPPAGLSCVNRNGMCVAAAMPTPKMSNIVSWITDSTAFRATDFQIQTQNKIFTVKPTKPCNQSTGETVCVHSNPAGKSSNGLHYTTLEVTWFEGELEMRMNIYLYSDGKTWWSNEIRVYNGRLGSEADWVYFYGRFFETPVGGVFKQDAKYSLTTNDARFGNVPVTLSFHNVNFSAFTNYNFSNSVMSADANGDGVADLVDFSIWKKEYTENRGVPLTAPTHTGSMKSDFDKNGTINVYDFTIWVWAYLGF